jgi:hypothetical protein
VPHSRALRIFLFVSGLIVLAIAAGIIFVGPLRWRAIVTFDKATGRLNDVKWSDVTWILGRRNGVSLERLAATRNPYASSAAPATAKERTVARAAPL